MYLCQSSLNWLENNTRESISSWIYFEETACNEWEVGPSLCLYARLFTTMYDEHAVYVCFVWAECHLSGWMPMQSGRGGRIYWGLSAPLCTVSPFCLTTQFTPCVNTARKCWFHPSIILPAKHLLEPISSAHMVKAGNTPLTGCQSHVKHPHMSWIGPWGQMGTEMGSICKYSHRLNICVLVFAARKPQTHTHILTNNTNESSFGAVQPDVYTCFCSRQCFGFVFILLFDLWTLLALLWWLPVSFFSSLTTQFCCTCAKRQRRCLTPSCWRIPRWKAWLKL